MGVEVDVRLFRNHAVCACGWQGQSRLFRGGAVLDGGLHLATHPAEVSQAVVTDLRTAC